MGPMGKPSLPEPCEQNPSTLSGSFLRSCPERKKRRSLNSLPYSRHNLWILLETVYLECGLPAKVGFALDSIFSTFYYLG